MDTQPVAVWGLLAGADRLVAAAGALAVLVPQTDAPPPAPPAPVQAAPISVYRAVDVVQLQGSTDGGVRTVFRAAVPGYAERYAPGTVGADAAGSLIAPAATTDEPILAPVTPAAKVSSHAAMANAEAHLQRRIVLVVA